jgi:hypothetical protein
MAQGPGQTVHHRLLILVDVAVAVGQAVGVAVFVIVMRHDLFLSFP